jgi:hypothetical protein
MFQAAEPLFFHGGREAAIHEEGRAGVAVIGVQPENVHENGGVLQECFGSRRVQVHRSRRPVNGDAFEASCRVE